MAADSGGKTMPSNGPAVSWFGERARPLVQGPAPSLKPLSDVSDGGGADCTRGRARAPIVSETVIVQINDVALFIKLTARVQGARMAA